MSLHTRYVPRDSRGLAIDFSPNRPWSIFRIRMFSVSGSSRPPTLAMTLGLAFTSTLNLQMLMDGATGEILPLVTHWTNGPHTRCR